MVAMRCVTSVSFVNESFFFGGWGVGGLFFNLAQKTRKEIKHRQLEAFFYPLLIKNQRHGIFFFSHKHGGEQ